MATIREAADALLRLADESLGVAREEPPTCDVRAVVAGVARLLRPSIDAEGGTLAIDVEADVPPNVPVVAVRRRSPGRSWQYHSWTERFSGLPDWVPRVSVTSTRQEQV